MQRLKRLLVLLWNLDQIEQRLAKLESAKDAEKGNGAKIAQAIRQEINQMFANL